MHYISALAANSCSLTVSGVLGDACEKFRMLLEFKISRKTLLTSVDCYWKPSRADNTISLAMVQW